MPNLSKRAGEIPMSPFRKLAPLADAAKASGKKVYHLNIGQPDIETPADALQKARREKMEVLAYSPAIGGLSLRKKWAAYYNELGATVEAGDFIITTGASEGLQWLFFACCNPGDNVVIPEPFYANYNGFAQIAGVRVNPVSSNIETGFALPPVEAFEAAINAGTKAICITNPSNPTGRLYSKEDLRKLAGLVIKHDLFLWVDEVYREFVYDGASYFCALELTELANRLVIVDSISKRYSSCGARIGALVSQNEELLEKLSRYAKLRLSPPVLGQQLAEALLEQQSNYLEQVVEAYDNRRRLVYRRLNAMSGVVTYKPGGAFYCFARFPVQSAEEFCRWLLMDFEYKGATLMLSPGEGFYASPGRGVDEVRIAYVLNENELSAAMDILEHGLIRYVEQEQKILVEKL